MGLRRSVYYPSWSISNPVTIFQFLVYWDKVAVIVPSIDWSHWIDSDDQQMRIAIGEAHEYFIEPEMPSPHAKVQIHNRVTEFVSESVPPAFDLSTIENPHLYTNIYPGKMLPETEEVLRNSGWARQMRRFGECDYHLMHVAIAGLLMSVIAEECAGSQRVSVTDHASAIQLAGEFMRMEVGRWPARTHIQNDPNNPIAALLGSIPTLGIQRTVRDNALLIRPQDINRMISIRKDDSLEAQRRNLCDKISSYVDRMLPLSNFEREIAIDDFRRDVDLDLKELKRELIRAGLEVLIDLDWATVATVFGSVFDPTKLTLLAGLGGKWYSYRGRRREVINSHWTSWLYSEDNKLTLV